MGRGAGRALAFAIVAGAFVSAACDDRAPALVVNLMSELRIPDETNSLYVTVSEEDGTRTERQYTLGDPPRDDWPQILPIVAGDKSQRAVRVEAELRNSRSGGPSVSVGYGAVDAMIPAGGETEVELEISRACEDRDGDGYGVGFGCLYPDCNDARPDIPQYLPCPATGGGDGGVPDGSTSNGDLPCTSPTGTNTNGECEYDEVCHEGYCRFICVNLIDCLDLADVCFEGVCICRVPCQDNAGCLFPFTCVDGCCRL